MPRSNYETQAAYNASRRGDIESAYNKSMGKKKKKRNKSKVSATNQGGASVGGGT